MRKTRLVYILAASHSGSTLLAMLLGSHPEVCTVGELKLTSLGDVDRYLCSCRSRIRECPFWREISQSMARRGFAFDVTKADTDFASVGSAYCRRLLRPLHRGPLMERIRGVALALSPTWRQELARIQARNAALVECICEQSGKTVIVDSSKVGLRLKYLLENPGLDVRVIRLIRDGRAVALTYTDPARFADASDPRLRGGGIGGKREDERYSVAQAAREWRRSNEEAESILRRLDPSAWIEVRYEHLCSQPNMVLRELFAFMGVGPGGTPRDFRASEDHVIGNGMRLDSRGDIRLDDRWKSEMAEDALEIFEPVAGRMNRRLGYM